MLALRDSNGLLQHTAVPSLPEIEWTLADVFRKLREMRGLRQGQLAAKAKVNRTTVNELETGKVQPDQRTQEKLATALGVSLRRVYADRDAANLLAGLSEVDRQEVLGFVETLRAPTREPTERASTDQKPPNSGQSATTRKARGA